MTKISGLGDNLYVSGYDFSGDVSVLTRIATPVGVLDVTAIDKSAFERIAGVLDGGIDYVTLFNPTADIHTALRALTSSDEHLMYCRGTALGSAAACLVAKQIGYDPTRASDGGYTLKTSAVANGFGLEWGTLLTAGKRTDTTATNGTGVDLTTVSTAFGWQAYLQVLSLTGTSVTVTLQDSADNAAWTSLTGGAFTAATTRSVQRLLSASSTATVRRYARAITTGTFSSAVFALALVRNQAARRVS